MKGKNSSHLTWISAASLSLLVLVSHADPRGSADSALILNATIFKLGEVGIAAHTSEEEDALASILAKPIAGSVLTNLLRDAKSNEAKLYALCGIRRLSHSLFASEAKRVNWSGETFNLMRADVVAKGLVFDQLEVMREHGCPVRTK